MPFHAAKPVPCIKCHATIPKGEPIAWTRGKGATPGVYHVICPAEIPAGVEVIVYPMAPGPSDETFYTATEPTDDDLPPYEDEPAPGTRAWFATATMADRECQLIHASVDCITIRDFNKVVGRYSMRLSDNETKRFKRYARGVWAGLTARFPADDANEFDVRQQSLLDEPTFVATHGEETQAWRSWVASQGATA